MARLEKLATVAAGVTALIPGAGYFANVAPPFFEATALLTSGVALAVVYAARNHRVKSAARPLAIMLLAIALTIAYSVGRSHWTVGPLAEQQASTPGLRIQAGFHLAPWSL